MGQKLGQHFLKSSIVAKKIVLALGIKPGELIIEIGPGKGDLTRFLVKEAQKNNCPVVGIEKDEALVKELGQLFLENKNFTVKSADVLAELEKIVSQQSQEGEPYKIVGNIPYYITGKLLRNLSELEKKPELVILMVQKEVAQRLSVKKGSMNLLAGATQAWADIKTLFFVKNTEFKPKPKVDSAVIKIKPKKEGVPDYYFSFLRVVFSHPRKSLLNNLAKALDVEKPEIEKTLAKFGLDKNSRAHELSVEQLKKLAFFFTKRFQL